MSLGSLRRTVLALVLTTALGALWALPASAAKHPAPVKTVTIDRTTISLGPVLVTVQGYTLYQDHLDTATASNCTGTCLEIWPPVLLPPGAKAAKAGKGVNQKLLGTFQRSDITGGPLQVTYRGEPLYRYVADNLTPGAANGQGKGNKWFVVAP